MTLRVASVVINCTDLPRMARFWSAALGYTAEGDDDWVSLTDPAGAGVAVALQRADTEVGKAEVHLDLHADDQAAECARLLALGATHRRDHHDPADDYVVLADPEVNEFCLCV